MTRPIYARGSGSSFNIKRKFDDEPENHDASQDAIRLIRSPPLKRRATFPAPTPMPELMADCGNSVSNSDEDMVMDQDGDAEMGGAGGYGDENEFVPRYDYEYGMSGSGGIGFGPGAEEDGEMIEESLGSCNDSYSVYPSLTPHTNPNHFSNIAPFTSNTTLSFGNDGFAARATSPLNAQAFSTSLRGPPRAGMMQPAANGPLPINASDVEKARSVHGPQCKSIPKLVISPHADPSTGKQSLWSQCPDCGAIERAA